MHKKATLSVHVSAHMENHAHAKLRANQINYAYNSAIISKLSTITLRKENCRRQRTTSKCKI